MIMKPRVLLLDEPTEGIQPTIIQQIGKVVTYRKSKGDVAIVLVAQYFDFAYGLADQFCVLRRGAVAMHGGRAELAQETLQNEGSVSGPRVAQPERMTKTSRYRYVKTPLQVSRLAVMQRI